MYANASRPLKSSLRLKTQKLDPTLVGSGEYGPKDRRTDRLADGQAGGRTDGQKDRWGDVQAGGRTDGQADGRIIMVSIEK